MVNVNPPESRERTGGSPSDAVACPRVLIAAPASGSGKTMITTGLLAALSRSGLAVSPHKVGPDYIDPGYHEAACGRPGRNLDAHLVGEHRILPLLLHGARTPETADIAVIEGVMGLFDGALGTRGFASSAHVATLTNTPVVLVVNCASASRSIGAMVKGFATFDPNVRIGGVILNNTASPRHEAEARAAVAEDLDSIMRLAKSAPEVDSEPWSPETALFDAGVNETNLASSATRRPAVAVAGGAAFTFGYTENTELLEAAGAAVVAFDPMHETSLPEGADALVLPGGFPQVYAATLAENAPMREQVRAFADSGRPVVAECAGMLYLGRSLDGQEMAGVLPIHTEMSSRLTLGYRTATAVTDSVVAPAGTTVTGHVFHRTRVSAVDSPEQVRTAWQLDNHRGDVEPDGYVAGAVHASYLHTHWAGRPQFAAALVDAANAAAGTRR